MIVGDLTYTLTATHVSGGTKELNPVQDDLIWTGQKDGDRVFIRPLLSSLTLQNDDYDYIEAIRASADKCLPIDLTVTVNFGGSTYNLPGGRLSALKVESFKPSECIVPVQVDQDDTYTCIYDNWEKEYNILQGTNKVEVFVLVGDLETVIEQDFTYSGPFPTQAPWTGGTVPTTGDGWAALRQFYSETVGVATTVWVREVITSASPPLGPGWINVGGSDWVREPLFSNRLTITLNDQTPGNIQYNAYRQLLGVDIQVSESGAPTGYEDLAPTSAGGFLYYKKIAYDNGVLLGEVLDKVNPCDGEKTFKSNFFRINQDATLPTAEPYPTAGLGFNHICIWQKSDVKRADSDQNATIGYLSFKELFEALKKIFEVEFKATSLEIIIEHISDFTEVQGLDLTAAIYAKDVSRLTDFGYITEEIPIQERFTWMDEQILAAFIGEIDYDSSCAGGDKEQIKVEKFTSDFASVVENSDRISDEGFFIAAIYEQGGVYYFNIEDSLVNGHLAFSKLLTTYLKWNRPFETGTIDNVETTFETSKRIKRQEPLTIDMTPAEFATFDAAELIQTAYGWGEVEQFSWSAKNCKLTVTIKHDD